MEAHWNWKVVTALLGGYAVLKEFRPIEPYLYNFMVADKNFTGEQLYGEVFPYWTYSSLVLLIPVLIVTDLFRYKPVILTENIFYIVTWVLLIWGRSLFSQQLMQVAYGMATASEVAYYSYIYARVDASHYQTVTAYTRASVQFGKCLAFVIGQLLISVALSDYALLNYSTLVALTLSFCIAITLPWIPWRTGVVSALTETRARAHEVRTNETPNKETDTYGEYVLRYFRTLLGAFTRTYSSGFVCKWSLWWALGTCGYYQIGNYIQSLWGSLQEEQGLTDQEIYNGIVEAITTGLGTATLLSLQFLHVDWKKWGELCLGVVSLFDCALLISMSYLKVLYIQYAFYIVFRLSYQIVITIAQYNLALKMRSQNYGLVFGFNTFIALALQTLLTFVVADKNGLNLDIATQVEVPDAWGQFQGSHLQITFTNHNFTNHKFKFT